MTITNKTNKIINIGTTILMPEESMTISDAVANTPAIKAFAKKGMVVLSEPKMENPEQDANQGEDKEPEKQPVSGETAEGEEKGKKPAKGAKK